MSRKVSIPAQNLPFRRQASLGGSVSYRNVNGTDEYNYVVLGKVTKVYYKLGRLDFTLVGENTNVVSDAGGDGNGSAPIPVDFFGYQEDGKPYGHYRPVQIGDLITLAFLNGHRSSPIVLGVYPNNAQSYEVLSPSLYETGDDRDSGVAHTALADQKVYPSGQIAYRSGAGDILKSLNGHSFMAISDHNSLPLDQIWATYDHISNFNFDGEQQDPQKTKAGDWLLVHEDNPGTDNSDNHITRFYVNEKGEFQIAQMPADYSGDSLILNGSKDNGFTVTKYYNHPSQNAGDKYDKFVQPDFDKAEKYVKFNLGDKDGNFSIISASKLDSEEQSTNLTVNTDGIFIDGTPLTSTMAQKTGDKGSVISNDPAFQDTLKKAQESAEKAAEEGKEAGLKATEAANQVGQDLSNMKDNMRYYMTISKDTDSHNGQPGYANMTAEQRGDLLGKFFDQAYIRDGNALQLKADSIVAGNLNAKNITVNDLDFNKGKGNHIQANIVDTGTLDAEKVNITNLNASNIHAGTLTANHINLGNLGDLSNYLGTIKAGSIDIGKVNKNGTVVDNPIKTETKAFVTDWLNTDAEDKKLTDIEPKTITELNTAYWQTVANRQVNVSFSCTVTNYQGQFDINKLEDEEKTLLHLPLGIEVKLTDDKNIVHVFQGVVDLGRLNLNGNSTIDITFKVDVPENVTASSAIAYGYVKADKIEIDNLKTIFTDPETDNLDSAFSVDSEGNVIARSLKAPGGEISGGTIKGGTITGGSIRGGSIDIKNDINNLPAISLGPQMHWLSNDTMQSALSIGVGDGLRIGYSYQVLTSAFHDTLPTNGILIENSASYSTSTKFDFWHSYVSPYSISNIDGVQYGDLFVTNVTLNYVLLSSDNDRPTVQLYYKFNNQYYYADRQPQQLLPGLSTYHFEIPWQSFVSGNDQPVIFGLEVKNLPAGGKIYWGDWLEISGDITLERPLLADSETTGINSEESFITLEPGGKLTNQSWNNNSGFGSASFTNRITMQDGKINFDYLHNTMGSEIDTQNTYAAGLEIEANNGLTFYQDRVDRNVITFTGSKGYNGYVDSKYNSSTNFLSQDDGISFDGYGNIHAHANSWAWKIKDTGGNDIFDVPTNNNGDFVFNPKPNGGDAKLSIQSGHLDDNGNSKVTHELTNMNLHALTVFDYFNVQNKAKKYKVVETSQGTLGINAYETAEPYYGDIGENETNENKQVTVGIDRIFNETINTKISYQVFLQSYSSAHVWVSKRYSNRFVVESDQPNAPFSWELKARQIGQESLRLENVDGVMPNN